MEEIVQIIYDDLMRQMPEGSDPVLYGIVTRVVARDMAIGIFGPIPENYGPDEDQ